MNPSAPTMHRLVPLAPETTGSRPPLKLRNLFSFMRMGFFFGLIAGLFRSLIVVPDGSRTGDLLPFGLWGACIMLGVGPILHVCAHAGAIGERVVRIFFQIVSIGVLGFGIFFGLLKSGMP